MSREDVTWENYWMLDARLSGARPMESIALHGKRQLFVDDYVIEHMENLTKTLHQPRKEPSNPVLAMTEPWETYLHGGTVLYEPEEKLFKMWYGTPNGIAYATSKDAIHWDKPSLGIVEWEGNIIVTSISGEQ